MISALPTEPDSDSFYDLVSIKTVNESKAWSDAAQELLRLADLAPSEKAFYFKTWAADALIGLGEIEHALAVKPALTLGTRSSMQTDRCLTLKMIADKPINGTDVATLFGPKLTNFGRQNIVPISQYLDVRVSQLQEHEDRNLLSEWSEDAHKHQVGMTLFSGHASYILKLGFKEHHFSLSPTAELMCTNLMRDAENTFREERDLPRIGEGWIAETALYYKVKAAFPDKIVLQHGRPEWLGRQHLDIYLPDQNVALEYQGEQHDRPIAFFGGEEAFLKNVARDQQKLRKCKRHGVSVIYVREGYILSDVIDIVQAQFS
jgi:hypothetical protein